MDIFKKCRDYDQAKKIIEAGIYPYFHSLETGQDTEVVMEGKKTVMIGSNNYLGFTSDKRVIEAGVEALQKYGLMVIRFSNNDVDTRFDVVCDAIDCSIQERLSLLELLEGDKP